MYTGFFKYNFEQWLSSDTIYQIFQLIGYKKTPAHTLTLDTWDNERLLVVAFELYLAYNQLCTFKGNVDLCSKYSMQDIFEGWFNTTGNVNNIQEWLIQRIAKSEYHSMYEAPDETMWPVTIGTATMFYDKNGQVLANPIKYPPNCQKDGFNETGQGILQHLLDREHDDWASGSFSSLPPVNLPDNELYGQEDSATSPTNLTNESNHLGKNSRVSVPSMSDNRGRNIPDDELYGHEDHHLSTNLSNEFNHLKKNDWESIPSTFNFREQMVGNAFNSNSGKQVVPRGGNGIRDGSHMYGNSDRSVSFKNSLSTDVEEKIIGTEGEKCLGLLASRIKIGQEKIGEQKGHDKFGHRFYYLRTAEDPPATERELFSFYQKSGHRFDDGHLRNSDKPATHGGIFSSDSCLFCGSPQALSCPNCGQIICQKCLKEKGHKCYRVSDV